MNKYANMNIKSLVMLTKETHLYTTDKTQRTMWELHKQ